MLSILSDVFHSASRHAIHTQSWVKYCLQLLFLVCSCLVRSQMAGFTNFNKAMRVQNTNTHIIRQLSTPLFLTWETKWSDIWQAVLLHHMHVKINSSINCKLHFDPDSSFSWRKVVCRETAWCLIFPQKWPYVSCKVCITPSLVLTSARTLQPQPVHSSSHTFCYI